MTDKPELAVAIVEALSAWSVVEVQLTRLFATLSDLETFQDGAFNYNKKAHLIFDTIKSFEARLEIIDALMGAEGLSELELETWNRCSLRLGKLYKRRHPLAHFVYMQATSNAGKDAQIAPFFTLGAAMRQDVKSLTTAQITERKDHFEEMLHPISYFEYDALKRRGLRLDNPMPEPPLFARFRASASRSLEERARKRQSPPPKGETEED